MSYGVEVPYLVNSHKYRGQCPVQMPHVHIVNVVPGYSSDVHPLLNPYLISFQNIESSTLELRNLVTIYVVNNVAV